MSGTVYIVGAGAIGQTLAVLLSEKGRDVVLVRASEDGLAPHLREIRVLCQEVEHVAAIRTCSLSFVDTFHGVVLVTAKSFGNADLAEKLSGKIGDIPVVLLQNGLGVERPFVARQFPELYRCVLFATAQLMGDRVVYKPVGASRVGIITRHATDPEEVVRTISSELFAFEPEESIDRMIWMKVISNCVFNSVCPLLEVDNGIFCRDASMLDLARSVIAECVEVARAVGVQLDEASVEKQVIHISRMSDGQKISTYQDIELGRRTEIDTLNMEIARVADTLGMGGAVQRTRLLGDLVMKKSELSMS